MHLPKPAAAVMGAALVATFAPWPAAAAILAGRDPGAPVCKPRHVMLLTDYYRVFGVYALSNGDRLRVRRDGTRVVAEMGRTGRVELLALSENRFAEKGGPLRFDFNPDAAGDEDDVVITGLELPRPRGRVCAD